MASVNFEVSPELDKELENLVNLTGSRDKSELLLRSIFLMKVAADAKQEGKKIFITTEDQKPVTEIRV